MKILILIAVASVTVFAQKTVGVFTHDSTRSYKGYTLFAPVTTKLTYLIDNDGNVVKSWPSQYNPGQAVMLLEDGTLLRTGAPMIQAMGGGGAGGVLEKIAWDGSVQWRYEHYGSTYRAHHDVEIMPNGNVLLLVWESHTRDEALAKGRDASRLTDNTLWSERIIEVKQTGPTSGEVVWSWSSWDHMIQDRDPQKPDHGVIREHPERVDINIGGNRSDWLHMNSVRYNAKRNEVLVSVHNLHEIWVISKETGNIVYRWGNPLNYQRGTRSDQRLFGQHDARWLDEDGTRISIFNNGQARSTTAPRDYSTVEEIIAPLDANGEYINDPASPYGPATPVWRYPEVGTSAFFATNISGATRLPNGNTLACLGPQGTMIEVTNEGSEVWRYVSPVGNGGPVRQGTVPRNTMIFKVYRYGPEYPALQGKPLIKQGKLEDGPLGVDDPTTQHTSLDLNFATGEARIGVLAEGHVRVGAFDLVGRFLGMVADEVLAPGTYIRSVPRGTFLLIRM